MVDKTLEEGDIIELDGEKSTFANDNALLENIDDALNSKGYRFKDIEEVVVNEGPGTRFSRTRTGVVVANAIGFANDSSVNDEMFAVPTYHKEPNITKPSR